VARIRTIKPEFWEDEVIADLSRDARLLFIATFNMADDEGLLRWTPAYIKSQAFIYDDDIDVTEAGVLMAEISGSGLIHAYRGGKAQQRLGWIVNFHKHQRVNRPQPSKLPAPSLQDAAVKAVYARRDGFRCHLCHYPTNEMTATQVLGPTDLSPSPDHLVPRSLGGNDYPSNIKTAHVSCNKGRGNRPVEDFKIPRIVLHLLGLPDSVNDSVNDAVSDSTQEGEGKGKGRGKGGGSVTATTTRPPRRCKKHLNDDDPPNCGQCADARKLADAWQAPTLSAKSFTCLLHPDQPAGRCPKCAAAAVPRPRKAS